MNATDDGVASDASVAAAPVDETLTASSVTHNSATLTIGNHTGDWYYKANAAPDASCSSTAVSTTTKNLTGLSGNTSYTYKAYSDSSCNTELASASAFLTKPGKPTKPTATAGAGSGKLTLSSSVTGGGTISKWQYRQKKETDNTFGDWQDISSTATSLSHTVTGLTDGTKYQFKVLAVNATGNSAASAASNAAAPANETLAASSVTHNSATLTIGNHSGNWHYKANAAPDASCSSTAVSTTTKNLTGLSGNTSYTYKAYSDSSCNTEPGRRIGVPDQTRQTNQATATAGAGSGKLTLSSSVTGGGTISKWQYQQKKETDGSFGDWQDIYQYRNLAEPPPLRGCPMARNTSYTVFRPHATWQQRGLRRSRFGR